MAQLGGDAPGNRPEEAGTTLGVLRPGELFHGRYRVVKCIAVGGMGAIYEVVDERTDAHRALKLMLPELAADADMCARFEREARVTANIVSDHLVSVSDAAIDEATATPFLLMELLRGEDLASLVEATGALAPSDVVSYLWQVALGLDKTHAVGVVHRDLKPENLFLTERDDGSPCVKILDFGIAKVLEVGKDKQRSGTTRAAGTPVYMSPEQILGKGIGPGSDIYSLAYIAYYLLTASHYWAEEIAASASPYALAMNLVKGATEAATARAQQHAGVALPPGFDGWFATATAVDPDNRFDHATEAVAALAAALGIAVPKASRAHRAAPSTVTGGADVGPSGEPSDRQARGEREAMGSAPTAHLEAPRPPTASLPTTTGAIASERHPPIAPRRRSRHAVAAAAASAVAIAAGAWLFWPRSSPPNQAQVVERAPTVEPSGSPSATQPAARATAAASQTPPPRGGMEGSARVSQPASPVVRRTPPRPAAGTTRAPAPSARPDPAAKQTKQKHEGVL